MNALLCRRARGPVTGRAPSGAGLVPCMVVGLAWVAGFVTPPRAAAEPLPVAAPDRKDAVRFQDEVLPFLAANCVACHNAKTKEGGLSLETVATILAGGDSGPGVVVGKPAESVLMVRAAHRDADADTMPPQGNSVGGRNLSPQELGLLERWIAEGAVAGSAMTARPIEWRQLPPGTGAVVSVDVTTDGRLTAAARGSRVSLFDTVSGTPLFDLVDAAASGDGPAAAQAHRDPIGAIAFAPAGDRIATGSFRTIKLWKRVSPRIAPLADTAAATAVAVSPDGTHAAVGLPDGTVAMVDLASGRTAHVYAIHTAAIVGLAFAPDGATLYSSAASGAVAATTLADGATTGRLARPAGTAALAVIDAGRLATAEPDNVVRVWALPLPAPPAAGAEAPAAPTPAKELAGATQPVTALAVVPTMPGHLVAGGGDGKARLWNADAGSVVREIDHGGAIAALAVRPDGSRMATAGTMPGLKLWNLADGKLVTEVKGNVRLARRLAAADLALAVDRQNLDFGKGRVTAAEKDVTDAAEERKKSGEAVAAAEKSLGEKTAAVAAAEKAKGEADAAVAAAQAAVPLATEAHAAAVKAQASATATAEAATASLAASTKAGNDPAAGESLNESLKAVKAAADAAVAQMAAQIERAKAKVSEVEKKATEAATARTKAQEEHMRADTALTSAKRAVEFAESRDKKAQEELPKRKTEAESLEKALAAATEARGALEKETNESARPATAVAFSRDGHWLMGLGVDGRLAVAGAADGGLRDTFEAARPVGAAGPPGMLASTGGRLLVAGANAPAATWDVGESWSLERTIGGESTPAASDDDAGGPPIATVTALAFSPDGTLLASGSGRASRSGEIKLWNVENGMLARVLPLPHTDTVMALAFSKRGDLLASGAADRFVKVHAVADGSPVRSFEGHTGHVLSVSWQAHGRRIASAGADNAVKIWDMVTGEQQRTITGPKKEATGVRFVGATDELITSAGDPLVRIYNVTNGAVVRDFGGAGDFVQTLAAAPTLVAVGAQDGKVRLWNLADAKALHTVEPAPARP
jgi:WD40 repeat protein